MAGCDQQYFTYNKFDWKSLNEKDALALEQTIVVNGIDVEFPTIEIEFTISNRPIKNFEAWLDCINSDAFRPKTCTIKLMTGKFPVLDVESTDLCQWYTEHLHIDPSPYPQLEAWDDKEIGAALKSWERKDFYRTDTEGDWYFDPETGRSRIELKEYYDGLSMEGTSQERVDLVDRLM